MIESVIIVSLLALLSVGHLGLGICLLVVWLRGDLMPTDRNIVIFWLILSFSTAAVGGIASIHLARAVGFLSAA
jgi:hypothetical protein